MGCILDGGVAGSIGPWWPGKRERFDRRQWDCGG